MAIVSYLFRSECKLTTAKLSEKFRIKRRSKALLGACLNNTEVFFYPFLVLKRYTITGQMMYRGNNKQQVSSSFVEVYMFIYYVIEGGNNFDNGRSNTSVINHLIAKMCNGSTQSIMKP